MTTNKTIHDRCINACVHFLTKCDYEVLDIGYVCDRGGLDIVAIDPDGVYAFTVVYESVGEFPNVELDRYELEPVMATWAMEHAEELPVSCELRFDCMECNVLTSSRLIVRQHVNALGYEWE